jgi:CheY-like chemotaxis protein
VVGAVYPRPRRAPHRQKVADTIVPNNSEELVMNEKEFKPLEVYCAEAKKFITPGSFEICPYFGGEQLDFDGDSDPIAQVFRCHAQCGCRITYRYRSGDEVIKKNLDEVADLEGLRVILEGALKGEASPEAYSGPSSEDPEGDRKSKILMVDDDEEFSALISGALRKRGFDVVTVSSADQALESITSEMPQLIILDVMMEHFDSGFALSKKIREGHGQIPTILFSAIGQETGIDFEPKSSEQLERMHADAFLDKGVTADELVLKIRELLDSEIEST